MMHKIGKVKDGIVKSGLYKRKPDLIDKLIPDVLVCPECGNIIKPHEDKKSYKIYPIDEQKRWYNECGKRVVYTCDICNCVFEKVGYDKRAYNRDIIKSDIVNAMFWILLVTMIISIIGALIFGSLVLLIIFFVSLVIFFVVVWKNLN